MISVKLLNGNIISRDADFSKYIETVSEPWVIKWFVVSATKVGIGMARVPVSRSNWEKLYVLVISDSETSISGNGDVYINIPQEIIDNWEIANEDWTGIATIEVGTMPSKNALKLATISNGTVTDKRNILKKVSDLEPLISALDERTATLEEEIGEILDKWAIDHLEESWIVWEKYTLSDTLFHQLEPISSNCTLEQNVADVSANTEIHIQRIASWAENNQLNLKLKKVWAPTQNLIVEVRRGVKVDVSSNEAYWYWDEVITSSEIAYGNITTDFAEYTVTFPESFWANQWDLLDIVLYQNWKIVNDINYYVIACDSTQYSEAYSFVAVNGTTRVRSKLMPYCSSVGFAQSLLCKVGIFGVIESNYETARTNRTTTATILFSKTIEKSGVYSFKIKWRQESESTNGNNYWEISLYRNSSSLQSSKRIKWTTYTELIRDNIILWEWDTFEVKALSWSTSFYCEIVSREFWYKWNWSYTSDIYYNPSLEKDVIYTFPNIEWKIKFSCYVWSNSTYSTIFDIYKNWESIYNRKSTSSWNVSVNIDLLETDTLTFGWRSSASSVQASNKVMDVIITYFWEPIRLTPTTIKEIWNIWTATAFWEVNWNFKGWQFIWETTDIITWDIALWNAVGYLVVNYNWNALKIPYYL